jgi:hypothetical protein
MVEFNSSHLTVCDVGHLSKHDLTLFLKAFEYNNKEELILKGWRTRGCESNQCVFTKRSKIWGPNSQD